MQKKNIKRMIIKQLRRDYPARQSCKLIWRQALRRLHVPPNCFTNPFFHRKGRLPAKDFPDLAAVYAEKACETFDFSAFAGKPSNDFQERKWEGDQSRPLTHCLGNHPAQVRRRNILSVTHQKGLSCSILMVNTGDNSIYKIAQIDQAPLITHARQRQGDTFVYP